MASKNLHQLIENASRMPSEEARRTLAGIEQAQGSQPEIAVSLARVYIGMRDYNAAMRCAQTAVANDTASFEAHAQLAVALDGMDRLDEALAAMETSLRLRTLPPNLLAYAILLNKKGKKDECLKILSQLVENHPEFLPGWKHLSEYYYLDNRPEHAIVILNEAVRRFPREKILLQTLILALDGYEIKKFNAVYETAIMACLADDRQEHQYLCTPWQTLLALHPRLEPLRVLLQIGDYDAFRTLTALVDPQVFLDPLLIEGLKKIRITTTLFERLVTFSRHLILEQVAAGEKLSAPWVSFAHALACQLFMNEYVNVVTPGEKELIKTLSEGAMDADALSALMMYKPLYRALHDAGRTPDDLPASLEKHIPDLIREQLSNPLREEKIRKTIPTFSPVEDSVSQKVKSQYEENPYPRWRSVATEKSGSRVDYESLTRGQRPLDLLVAGCGTGRHAISATIQASPCNTTAIDLSFSSLAYAKRKAAEMDFKINFMQGDILDLPKLNQTFDVIECAGVLHHMADPMAGWRVLTGLLRPGGFMNIGLYSETARRNVVACRDYIREKGYDGANDDDIRQFREDIKAAAPDDPKRSIMSQSDFYTLSNCRDLVFHVQEHRFTLPQIGSCLDELGLTLLNMALFRPDKEQAYRQAHPDDPHIRNLEYLDTFEQQNPSTFETMYQFWLQKK